MEVAGHLPAVARARERPQLLRISDHRAHRRIPPTPRGTRCATQVVRRAQTAGTRRRAQAERACPVVPVGHRQARHRRRPLPQLAPLLPMRSSSVFSGAGMRFSGRSRHRSRPQVLCHPAGLPVRDQPILRPMRTRLAARESPACTKSRSRVSMPRSPSTRRMQTHRRRVLPTLVLRPERTFSPGAPETWHLFNGRGILQPISLAARVRDERLGRGPAARSESRRRPSLGLRSGRLRQ